MSDDVEVEATTAKKGLSPLVAALIGGLSLVIGYGAGAFTGGPVYPMIARVYDPRVEQIVPSVVVQAALPLKTKTVGTLNDDDTDTRRAGNV